MKKTAKLGAALFVLDSEWWREVNWNGMKQIRKEKFTGEIEKHS